MNYFRKYCDSPDFTDLRNIADDKTVLENPHKGWYLHYIDNGVPRSIYRDDIAKGDYLEYVPGLDHLYLRIDWNDVEKQEGVFDWSYIDSILSEWGQKGYHFAFRFCTYEGSSHDIPYATPKWVFDRGAKYTKIMCTENVPVLTPIHTDYAVEPDYGDERFLHYVDLFLAECARKFDGDPNVEYIDIGTFGTWGEGHTYAGSNRLFPLSVLQKHIDLHLKHFKKTQLLMMYGYVAVAAQSGMDGIEEFIEHNQSLGLGLRCDSVGVSGYVADYAYDSLQTPDLFDIFGENAPVNLENAHQQLCPPEQFRDGLTLLEAAKNAHATYAGFHGYISQWWPKNRYLHEYLANRLGYWYFIHGVELKKTVSLSEGLSCVLHIENKGYARAYHHYEPVLMLADRSGGAYFLPCETEDNRLWLPGEKMAVKLRAKLKNTAASLCAGCASADKAQNGNFEVYFGLRENERMIRFAVKQEYCRDGLVHIGTISIIP